MCVSRLHKVVAVQGVYAEVEALDGMRQRISLIALDGPAPQAGDWLVVHSGYALDRADREEAESVAEQVQHGMISSQQLAQDKVES